MSRVNITIPDDTLARARAAGLNVSRVATQALAEELDRRAKVAALEEYLRELDEALGPISREDQEAAAEWADALAGQPAGRATRSA